MLEAPAGRLAPAALLALLALTVPATSQTSDAGPVEDEEPPSSEAADARVDPFSADAVLLAPPTEGASRERRFLPAPSLPERLPMLTLKGVGRASFSDPPTAILEVGSLGTFVVRPGDVLSLQNLPGENVLRIKSIDDISVTVEAGSFGEIIVVR